MKAVSYIRVSTKKQGESALGLESQQAIIKHFYPECEREFKDVESGSLFNREKLQEAIKYCEDNDAWLVVAKLDRLSRKTEDILKILEMLERRVIFCDIPSGKFQMADKFTITLFAAIADRERELISIRTKLAMDRKKERDGEWRKAGRMKPWHRELGPQAQKAKAAANENNIRATEMIIAKKREGWSVSEIAKILNQKKFKTSQGKEFRVPQVNRLLTRAGYVD